jgi:hypothetical protein
MAPKKASKKTEEQPEGDIISDTTAAGVIHNVKSWAAIAEKMEYLHRIIFSAKKGELC